MEELKEKAEKLTESIGEYVQTYYKLTVLNATEKATEITASTLAAFVVFFLGIFVLFFLGIALGLWLGYLLNNVVAGYLLVAGLFLFFVIILVLLRKRIVFPMIRNLIIRKLYE